MYNKKEREYYNVQRQRACERLGITKNDYNWFRRQGIKLNAIYTADCNGCYPTEELALEASLPYEKKAKDKAKDLGLCIYFQTDPRGATIYLDKEPIKNNDYTKAVCIY